MKFLIIKILIIILKQKIQVNNSMIKQFLANIFNKSSIKVHNLFFLNLFLILYISF